MGRLPLDPAREPNHVALLTERLLCRFFQWFWFSPQNRTARWKTTVAHVRGPFTFIVDSGGGRSTVWLRGEGCRGYEVDRQIFILLGEWLRRFRWFNRWNKDHCDRCGHTTSKNVYRDFIEGTLCESQYACEKCGTIVYEFAYGYEQTFVASKWQRLETKIFGSIDQAAD